MAALLFDAASVAARLVRLIGVQPSAEEAFDVMPVMRALPRTEMFLPGPATALPLMSEAPVSRMSPLVPTSPRFPATFVEMPAESIVPPDMVKSEQEKTAARERASVAVQTRSR